MHVIENNYLHSGEGIIKGGNTEQIKQFTPANCAERAYIVMFFLL